MMRKIILSLILTISLALPLVASASAAPITTSTQCPGSTTSQGQILEGVGETGSHCDSSGVSSLLSTIVGILSYVVGAVAILMVIVSGFKYITSGGDSAKVGNAKNTLIYAVIGVAVAALAQLMVHYVLSKAGTVGT
jgi:hypothetical protein